MNDKAGASPVKTAARTLDVFEAFCDAGEPLSLTELAERINSPVSSCHALVKTLQARGYVYLLDQRRRIYPTKRLLEIATDISARDPLLRKITPLMTALRDRTGETVIMGKRQGNEVIYLDVVEGTHTVRYTAHPGEGKPLHSSAIGKSMLSLVRDAELKEVLGKRLERKTPTTLTEVEDLRADLEEGRRRGYFITRGENVVDVMAVAVANRVAGENLGFAVAGPMGRMETNFDRYITHIKEFATEVERLNDTLSRVF